MTSTFDAGAGNGNDIVLQALADTSANLIWKGNVSSDWDVQVTANWITTNNVVSTFTNLDKVTFVFRTGKKGHYRWQCFVPCAAGFVYGFGGPMQTVGYMDGYIDVV